MALTTTSHSTASPHLDPDKLHYLKHNIVEPPPVRAVLRHWRFEVAYLIGQVLLAVLLYGLLWLVI
jgi:hypothetical protein